jgi:heme exporter protein B
VRYLRHAGTVARKDLRVEWRTREIFSTTAFFAAALVLVCSFAFVDRVAVGHLAAGVLWIAVAFAATLGISRAFEREREASTMRALLLSPAERGAIYLGKAAAIAVSMLIVEVVVVVLVTILFGAPVDHHPVELALILVTCTIGIAIVGAAFAGMLLGSRSRGVLLPVVLYPVITPALIAGTMGTAAIWSTPAALPEAWFWIKFLVVFDAIFLSVSLWAFEALVIE